MSELSPECMSEIRENLEAKLRYMQASQTFSIQDITKDDNSTPSFNNFVDSASIISSKLQSVGEELANVPASEMQEEEVQNIYEGILNVNLTLKVNPPIEAPQL